MCEQKTMPIRKEKRWIFFKEKWVFVDRAKLSTEVEFFVLYGFIMDSFCNGHDMLWTLLYFNILIIWKLVLKLINNSSRENKENHYRDHGLDMWS